MENVLSVEESFKLAPVACKKELASIISLSVTSSKLAVRVFIGGAFWSHISISQKVLTATLLLKQ